MGTLIKPKLLQQGDKAATISLSREEQEACCTGPARQKQLQETFELEVVETTNAL